MSCERISNVPCCVWWMVPECMHLDRLTNLVRYRSGKRTSDACKKQLIVGVAWEVIIAE